MLLALAGPSTIGKDSTWVRVAQSIGFTREVPYTTRQMREGEKPGVDYNFVTVRQFQAMIRGQELTEWDYTLKAYYGTEARLEEKILQGDDIVVSILARMALRFKRRFPSHVRTVMLLTSDFATLSERLHRRGYRPEELAARVEHAAEESLHAGLFDLVVPDADILPDIGAHRVLEDFVGSRKKL
jgi:guanylate kinase